ncbi:MAG: sigma-70 family RNA polymerase sigma factor [Planctomycetes bacterium]|nr:sigma-70 family RNA polymerase sigma factor [Planctomycetota bacterium]
MPADEERDDTDLRAALEEIAPRLFAWAHCRLYGRAAQEADDVVQETLCRALDRLDRFRGGSLAAWLFTIANNVVLEFLRRSRRRPQLLAPASESRDSPLANVVARATTLTRAVARRDDVRALLELAESFDETDRRILLLCGLEDLPAREAAIQLGSNEEAVQKRWYRLRQRLRFVPWIRAEAGDGSG